MKPYTLTLTAEEVSTIGYALRKGKFYADQFAKKGSRGDREIAERIGEALEILNRPLEGGFESDEERNAHALASTIAECDRWGSN